MIPLRDTIRSYSFPVVNWLLIGANLLVFLFEISLPPAARDQLILQYGLIPARLHLLQPQALLLHPGVLLTLFSHMFLHGGWFHIISNLWVLYIFGDNVEDRMGHGRYFLFYILGGLVAGITQSAIAGWVSPAASQAPAIGASGAIAAILGAYFLMFPRGRVLTLILLIVFPLFVEIPAIFFLGFWFVSQLFSGVTSLGMRTSVAAGGVAWWAHIGGFIYGMIFYRAFSRQRRPTLPGPYPRSALDDKYRPD